MAKQITFPPSWMAEARESYDRYVVEWRAEETERAVLTGDDPEEPETWEEFFVQYHYAELESSVFVDFVNKNLQCLDS